MAKFIIDPEYSKTVLDKLDSAKQREIRRKMVQNGAKVLIKEMQKDVQARHHVVHGWLKDSIAAGPVYEDVDGTSIEVYPQGNDPRGVSNAMKLQIITSGYYHVASGRSSRKKDNFLNNQFRQKCAPRINSVMNYTLQLCMQEING